MERAPSELESPASVRHHESTSNLRPAARSGQVLASRYLLKGLLGSGGMGEVYEAEHLRLRKLFAVKLLRAEYVGESRTVEGFAREARAVAMLRSDHIVSIVDSDVAADDSPFFVMERLHGSDLRVLLHEVGPLAVTRAVHLIIDACHGVREAHRVGLIHRDLKPSNLFVATSDRGVEVCKVLDFGVAKLLASDSTKRGGFVGTIRYMAPEQLREGARVDTRTDVYALGAILYECLAGRPPFADAAVERVLFAILHESPPALSELGVLVPDGLARVVTRALARRPEDRFASIDELLATLAHFVGWHGAANQVDAAPDDPTLDTRAPRRVPPRSPTRAFAVGAGAGVCVALALFLSNRVESQAKLEDGTERALLASSVSAPTRIQLPAVAVSANVVTTGSPSARSSIAPGNVEARKPLVPRGVSRPAALSAPRARTSAAPETEPLFDATSPYEASARLD